MKPMIFFLYFFQVILNAESTIPVDSLFSIGNRYFSIEKYDYALDAYLAILEKVENPDLYFNIGNTYYRQGNLGQAIWAYEKGIQLSPLHKDLKYNLDFVNARVKDRIEVPKGILFIEMYRTIKRNVKLNDLLLWGGIMMLLASFATFFKIFNILDNIFAYRITVILFIFSLLLHMIALDKYWEISDKNEGIIISSIVNVRSAPIDRDEKIIFRIHEGLKVDIVQSQPGWFEIILLDGKKGWIEHQSLLRL